MILSMVTQNYSLFDALSLTSNLGYLTASMLF